ncbi:hypothetical protein CHU98_g7379 [Xylaria longipes]|nr:hypothetical protein CHU98_g7379 [Xylaria longipes]
MAESSESQQVLLPHTDTATVSLTPTVNRSPNHIPQELQSPHLYTQPANNQSQNTLPRAQIPRKPLAPDVADQQMPSQPTQHIGSTRGSGWAWEYVALALSASAITTQIILLAYIDNLQLSHWRLPTSPTTVVSILAAISRASIGFTISSCLGQAKWNWLRKRPDSLLAFDRFDDASRGPWGSFWLIIWVRAYHRVAIGAAVTILLLAFEPFFQAILSFDGGTILSESAFEARISRNEILDAGTYYNRHTTSMVIPLPSNETITLEAYVYQPDLGMVSALNNGFYNISKAKEQTTSFVCPTANCTWNPFTTLAACGACNDITDHLKREKKEGINLGNIVYNIATLNTSWTINSLPDVNLTNVLKAADDYINGYVIWDDTSVIATDATFDKWNNYSVFPRVNNGERYNVYDLDRSNLELLIPLEDTQRFYLPENITRRFALTQHAVGSTVQFVNNEFFSEQMVWPLDGDGAYSTPPVVQALYQSTNLSATFNNAARSMTNWMRDISNTSPQIGTAQEWAIWIHVEWAYIAAPLATFVAGLAFCIYCIFETHKLGLEPWKTAAIATLTHSVDAETRAQLRHAYRQGYLDKAARAMIVAYEDVGNGLELKAKQS